MNLYRQIVTKYPFSIICILVIWYLSFFTPPQTELDNVPFIDKWTHLVMYGGTCSVMWIEYWRSHPVVNKWKLAVWAWAAPIVMSGCIELLQEYCTNGRRDGDWADLLANSIGVSLAAVAGILLVKCHARGKKDSDGDDHYKNDGRR